MALVVQVENKYFPKKEILETAVTAIKMIREKQEKWQETFDEMFDGGAIIPTYNNSAIDAIIHMVEIVFNDLSTDTMDSIFSWWIFDTNFGKNSFADSLSVNQIAFPMKSIDDLYEYYKYMFDKTEE